MEWSIEEGYAPSAKTLALINELTRDDPHLQNPLNRERFVDATIADAKADGREFEDEEALRRDALEYLDTLL